MGDFETAPACLVALEGALVSEFRAYQTLVSLAKEERRALSSADLNALSALVAQKETLLGELNRLEISRCSAIEVWSRLTAGNGRANQAPDNSEPPDRKELTLAAIIPRIDSSTAGRLGRLREGILALAAELNDLTHGNRVLAVSALERLEAVRNFLLSLSQPPMRYHPPGAPAPSMAEPALAGEHWA